MNRTAMPIEGFNRDLEFRLVGADSKIVMLTADLTYLSAAVGGYYVIPAGFACDLASVPKSVAALAPDWRRSARAGVLHDAAYRWGEGSFKVGRAKADALLREALLLDGVDRFRARAMWAAVRTFAGKNFHRRPMFWKPVEPLPAPQ